MSRYRVLPLLEGGQHVVGGVHAVGDEFDHDFPSADDEAWWLERGLLELLPRRYKVVGPRVVHGTQPGDTFEAALSIGQEAALLEGGHIQRVGGPRPEPDPEPTKPKRGTRKAAPKE